jgi:hypothetical protein
MEAVSVVLEVLDDHGRVAARHRLQLADGNAVTLGRAVDCDIMLDDSHVAARHASLRLADDGVRITDLGSVNGITLNGKRTHGTSDALLTTPELQLGRTRLRVRTSAETLAPEKADVESWRLGSLLWLSALGAVLVYGATAYDAWLRAPDNLSPVIGEGWLGMTAVLAVWISAWTLLGRINSGEWRWALNAAVCLVALAVSDVVLRLVGVLVFATQSTHSESLTLILTALVVATAGYAQLRAVTRVRPRRLAVIAAVVTLVAFGATTWFSSQRSARNVDSVEPMATLYPPALRLVKGSDPEALFARAAALREEAERKRSVALTQEP